MSSNDAFAWTKYYIDFADKLLLYKDKRPELLKRLRESYQEIELKYPLMEHAVPVDDVDPFTVFGCFNKGITDVNRIATMKAIGSIIGMQLEPPSTFDGIPVLNNMNAWYFGYKEQRKPEDISNLWDVFETALAHADKPSDLTRAAFISYFDKAKDQMCVGWKLSVGLYWVRPYSYINLDSRNRSYITSETSHLKAGIFGISSLKQHPNASTYLEIIELYSKVFANSISSEHSFPELSLAAWNMTKASDTEKKASSASFLKWFSPIISALKALDGSATPEQTREQIIDDLQLSDETINETRGKTGVKKFDNEVAFARNYLAYEGYIDNSVRGVWTLTDKGMTAPINDQIASDIFLKWVDILKERREGTNEKSTSDRNENEIRYWLYAPGRDSRLWDEFYSGGIMGIGWEEMGDLMQYSSKDAMKAKMKEVYGPEYSYQNDALATWQFTHELQKGDIVYSKKGRDKIIGRGIVESDFIYDASRKEYTHIRKVKWTHNGVWEHPGTAALKTLTDITSYTDYVEKLEALFLDDETGTDSVEKKEVIYPAYTEVDFLSEVFVEPARYETLVNLLRIKKNIILQGAPGVGKTFAARRLAYSLMGKKDASRALMVQFHQSYSYEDFIMGYRPSKDGFELVPGPFYQFCKTAQDDNERDYYFIIDEINRGNLSKIFGELMMLIETDKRGEKLRLLYSNELFSVPKNVHIIGMMNTADRSLAMIDYALRRRFAFFVMEPAFEADGFKTIMEDAGNPKYAALVDQVKALNEFIRKDEALGDGFRIGHSYLCPKEEITDEWLNSVVEYELLPLLGEYWFDEADKVKHWENKLRGTLQ